MKSLTRYDWDFSALDSAPEAELIACCMYEFARESNSIREHYNNGKPISSYPGGLAYCAVVDGVRRTLQNPFQWAWSRSSGELFVLPWQDMPAPWRESVIEMSRNRGPKLCEAFISGDSQFMKQDILSRGDDRAGIDPETGRERIVVELDWTALDSDLIDSFKQWLSNRPDTIGRKSDKGQDGKKSWKRKLDNISIMRLFHHARIEEWAAKFPEVWNKYFAVEKIGDAWIRRCADTNPKAFREYTRRCRTSTVTKEQSEGEDRKLQTCIREVYKKRADAACDFRELFPFLPEKETPCSMKSCADR